MRPRSILLPLVFATLAGCAHDGVDRSYAGSSGSTYDAAANPPQSHGAASYNPASTLKPHDYGNGGEPVR